MNNIHSYVHFRKDIAFSYKPFNEVDGLLFALLAYVDFTNIIQEHKAISLKDACVLYRLQKVSNRIVDKYIFEEKMQAVMELVEQSNRYKDVMISDHTQFDDVVNYTQFGAIRFVLEGVFHCVAYRGTDTSVLGWKENFRLIYESDIEGYALASEYLKNSVEQRRSEITEEVFQQEKVYCVGHSKGGHLAMVAAAKCDVRDCVHAIFNYDGPGTVSAFREENPICDIEGKVFNFYPEDSFVGRTLIGIGENTIIRADASGLLQHDGFAWQCEGEKLVRGNSFSQLSNDTQDVITKLFFEASDVDKRACIERLFAILDTMELHTVQDVSKLNVVQMFAGVKEVVSMKSGERAFLYELAQFVIRQSRVIKN